jgi:hypothetical protein
MSMYCRDRCFYVYGQIFLCVETDISMSIHVHVYIRAYVYACIYIARRGQTSKDRCFYVDACTCMYASICICIYVYS